MTREELKAAKPGDPVTVYGTFRIRKDDLAAVTISHGPGGHLFEIWVDPKEIATHTPRPLAVGDTVRREKGGISMTLLAINGDVAWCVDGGGEHFTLLLEWLVRA